MRESKCKFFTTISLAFSLISSLPVLLCILDPKNDKDERILIFIASAIFWLGLIFEQLFIWLANFQRKKQTGEKNQKVSHPGVISFFKSRLGRVSDITLIISVIAFIIMSAAEMSANVVQFIVLFFIVLSFRFHCITNGKNYLYKPEKKKRGAKS